HAPWPVTQRTDGSPQPPPDRRRRSKRSRSQTVMASCYCAVYGRLAATTRAFNSRKTDLKLMILMLLIATTIAAPNNALAAGSRGDGGCGGSSSESGWGGWAEYLVNHDS